MSEVPLIPNLRRVVTFHNEEGTAVVQSDSEHVLGEFPSVPGLRSGGLWLTEIVPSKDANDHTDGALRQQLDAKVNAGLVNSEGVNLRATDIAPGGSIPMHRTATLDYNILVHGEIVLIMEDGKETHLKNSGDIIVQKGTLHAWRNPGTTWCRFVSVVIAAEPAVVNGKELGLSFPGLT